MKFGIGWKRGVKMLTINESIDKYPDTWWWVYLLLLIFIVQLLFWEAFVHYPDWYFSIFAWFGIFNLVLAVCGILVTSLLCKERKINPLSWLLER